MGELVNLLRWKKEVTIGKGDETQIVYLRVIGDHDIQESFRLARIASARRREELRNPESPAYKDEVAILDEATEDQCIEIITASKVPLFESEAVSAIVRPDLPEIEEVAIDPDAPTLEEQEKLDTETIKVEDEYQLKLREYVDTKKGVLTQELITLSIDVLREQAKDEIANIFSLGAFMEELNNQKVWRGTYVDKLLKTRGYDSVDEFIDASPLIRSQLLEAYAELEIGPEELKN